MTTFTVVAVLLLVVYGVHLHTQIFKGQEQLLHLKHLIDITDLVNVATTAEQANRFSQDARELARLANERIEGTHLLTLPERVQYLEDAIKIITEQAIETSLNLRVSMLEKALEELQPKPGKPIKAKE